MAMRGIGERIKKLRKEVGLSQQDLAPRLGIHSSQYARYEVERSLPSFETLIQLSKFFDVSVDYLIFGEDKEASKKTKINDPEVLDLFRRVNKLKKPIREQVKWGIESLLSHLPGENNGITLAQDSSQRKTAKSAR